MTMSSNEGVIRKRKRRRKSSSELSKENVVKDGEELVRVKKRHRRTKQKKEVNQDRLLKQVFWRTFIALISVFTIASYIGLRLFYVNGPNYEKDMVQKLEDELQAKVDLRGLAFSPRAMRAGYLEYTATDKNAFVSQIGFSKLTADQHFWGIFSESWSGNSLEAAEGVMRIHPECGAFTFAPSSKQFYFAGLNVKKFDVYEELNPLIENSTFSLQKDSFVFSEGEINLPLFGKITLDRLSGNFHSSPTSIDGVVITNDKSSKFEGKVENGNIDCMIDSMTLSGKSLSEPIKSVANDSSVSFTPVLVTGKINNLSYKGNCFLQSQIETFTGLTKWIQRFGGKEYSVELDDLIGEGAFTYTKEGLVIDQIRLEAKSGVTFELWNLRENETFDLDLHIPLKWQSRIELYPNFRSLLSVTQSGFKLRLKCMFENGQIVDDLEDRLFKLLNKSNEVEEEKLREQLEELLR